MESRVGPNKITRDPCGDDGDGHGTDPDPLARQNVTGCATPRARQTLRQSLRQSCAKVCAKIFLGKRPLPLKVTLLTWIVTLLRIFQPPDPKTAIGVKPTFYNPWGPGAGK